MKITFGMIVLNGDQVLEETLSSVYPYAHQILIAEGPVGYWQQQGYTTSMDGTNEILENFPDPDNKIKIVHSQYSEKDEQCNAYMEFLDDETDYIWNLDCDEVFKPEDIEKVINLLETERYNSVGFKSILSDEDDKSVESVDPYPICIEIPEGYWTVTSTADDYEYSYKEKK